MSTRKEVAKLAGVSEATVSRVLNGVGPVKEETRRLVLEAARRLDYQPSAIAQSFARGKSGNLGVVLPYVPKVHLFSAYYFSEILSGIGEEVRARGYSLLLLFRSPDEEADYVSYYRTQKVDACIILGASDLPQDRQALARLSRNKLPFCVINQHYGDEGYNEVDADHRKGSVEAVRHLVAKGFKKIAFLNGSPHYSNSRDREAGYRMAIREAGLQDDEGLLFTGNYSRTSGIENASKIVKLLPKLDAVFAANDRMAVGLMQGLQPYGIRAGRDLALIGYDDSDAASLTDPPLSTVHVPFYEMGRKAARKLLDLLAGEEEGVPFQERLATHLVIRQSCTKERIE